MKSKIIKLLKESSVPLSGEAISQDLGVSRVSVHKHINGLRDKGYIISASSAGYVLEDEGDFLYPWEFGEREPLIHFFEETTSTMKIARDLAEEDCPHMTVAVAERQTAGRGRLDRTWDSRDGGLYFTMVIRPRFPINQVYKVLFTASVCLAASIRELTGVEASVKWPNDILVGDRKLCGMLSEMATQDEFIQYVNLGIGVNVNNDPTSVEPSAVSIKSILGKSFPRREILAGFLERMETRLSHAGQEDVIALWKQYASTLGKKVRIQTVKTTLEGTAVDVDQQGSLIVELPDGSQEVVFHGDCFHQSNNN